jgi:hypothetical protein
MAAPTLTERLTSVVRRSGTLVAAGARRCFADLGRDIASLLDAAMPIAIG